MESQEKSRDKSKEKDEKKGTDSPGIIINEIQLILADKRTSLATLRTGIAIFALPLSVLSFLIATSKCYDITKTMPFFIPLMLINLSLIILAFYLIIKSVISLRHQDKQIKKLKAKNQIVEKIIE